MSRSHFTLKIRKKAIKEDIMLLFFVVIVIVILFTFIVATTWPSDRLMNVCVLQIESYWTYEVCHGKHVRQYHEDKETGQVKCCF